MKAIALKVETDTMCGRFTLTANPSAIAQTFGIAQIPHLRPSYNIAPSQGVMVIRWSESKQTKEAVMMQWGLVPFWVKDLAKTKPLINARVESAQEKASFRAAFSHRRCLIPADGFYEWSREGDKKQPHYVQLDDHRLFAFAGLWESWQRDEGDSLETCAILTTAATAVMEPIHARMPVIIQAGKYEHWLDYSFTEPDTIHALLAETNPDLITYVVSSRVNSPRNNDERCIARKKE